MLSSGGWAVLIIGGAMVVEAFWIEARERWHRREAARRGRTLATRPAGAISPLPSRWRGRRL
jgi:hypothetical protein